MGGIFPGGIFPGGIFSGSYFPGGFFQVAFFPGGIFTVAFFLVTFSSSPFQQGPCREMDVMLNVNFALSSNNNDELGDCLII